MRTTLAAAALVFTVVGFSGSDAFAHSIDEARDKLEDRGFYDIRVERATLPYSFTACKRGGRYHIHIDYYGTLTDVDRLGPCDGDDDGPRYDRGRGYRGYNDYRRDDY